ncbi:MAG: rod shape-determining protein MreD [Betaproteobacteria bacterium]|nr:rod shape-determining protein MreD [Betaproteobacteria bacterium]
MDLSPISREPMRPPTPKRVLVGSIAIALFFNLLPWNGLSLRLHPDFVLLVLLYWSVHESRTIGQGWGFAFGLMMDVADSVLLGQHAMIYVVAIFITQLLRLRILQLSVLEQALHIGAILLVALGIGIFLNFSLGRAFAGYSVILSPVLGGLLWPILSFFITRPRFQRQDPRTTIVG